MEFYATLIYIFSFFFCMKVIVIYIILNIYCACIKALFKSDGFIYAIIIIITATFMYTSMNWHSFSNKARRIICRTNYLVQGRHQSITCPICRLCYGLSLKKPYRIASATQVNVVIKINALSEERTTIKTLYNKYFIICNVLFYFYKMYNINNSKYAATNIKKKCLSIMDARFCGKILRFYLYTNISVCVFNFLKLFSLITNPVNINDGFPANRNLLSSELMISTVVQLFQFILNALIN